MSAILTSRVLPKISPTLLEMASTGQIRLASLEISGSLNTTFLGIMSTATSWAETPNAYEAILADRLDDPGKLPWFTKMFTLPSLNYRELGGKKVLTTDKAGSFLTRQSVNSSVDFASHNVKLGLDVRVAYQNSGVAGGWQSSVAKYDASSSAYGTFKYLIESLGLQPVIQGTMFVHGATNVGSSGAQPFDFASTKASVEQGASFGYYMGGVADRMLDYNTSVPPGQKMMQVYVYSSSAGGQTHKNLFDWLTNYGGSPDWNSPFFFAMSIPYVDDGRGSVPVMFISNGAVFVHFAKDRRYGGGASRFDLNPTAVGLARLADSDGLVRNIEGKLVSPDAIPLSGYQSTALGDFHFLPYLAAPLTDMHMILTAMLETTETFTTDEGAEVEVLVYKCATELFCTKVDKAWYEAYHLSGFGLFAPRPKAIRDKNIAAVNALDFETMGICLDNASSVINPDIVFQTDLALAYKKAREKACKDNDWLDQKFIEDITYREVRNAIVRQPLSKAFYSVTGASNTVNFNPVDEFGSVRWEFLDSAGAVATTGILSARRTDVETSIVESYEINDTARDLIIAEYGGGAQVNIAVYKTVFAVSADDAIQLDNMQVDTEERLYTDTDSQFSGVRLKHQLYTPAESLSLSGYPLYRYMASPYREAMVMRMYADFKTIGDGFVRIIQSFLSETIVTKLLK